MRAVSFGKVIVATAGTPVNLGVSTTSAALAVGATSLAMTSAVPFSPDMLPFTLTLDAGASLEKVTVTGISGSTFTISPCTMAHNAGVAARADDFNIFGFIASTPDTNTGKAWLGTRLMATGDGPGTIRKFCVTANCPVP